MDDLETTTTRLDGMSNELRDINRKLGMLPARNAKTYVILTILSYFGAVVFCSFLAGKALNIPASVQYQDVNKDGVPDIIVRNYFGREKIFLGNLDGTYSLR